MSQFSHVVFDFDGTLADSLSLMVEVFNQLGADFGYNEITKDKIEKFRTTPGKEGYLQIGIDLDDLPAIVKVVGQELQQRIHEVHPFEGIREVLEQLQDRSIKTGILTSTNPDNPRQFFEQHSLPPVDFIYADKTVFNKDVLMEKMLQEQQLDRDKVLYVGDEVRDVLAANRINLPIAAVTWGYNDRTILEESQPSFIVDSPSELIEKIIE